MKFFRILQVQEETREDLESEREIMNASANYRERQI